MKTCNTCNHWQLMFLDLAAAWGKCTNPDALALQFVTFGDVAEFRDHPRPRKLMDAIIEKSLVTYVGNAFGCIHHEDLNIG